MRHPIHAALVIAIVLACLLARPYAVDAGDFLYSSGGLRGGDYSGRVTVSGTSDSEAGNIAAVYPGDVDRVAIRPGANVAGSEHPGYGVCEFYHGGWAAEYESAFVPPYIFEPHGRVEFEMSADIFAATSLKNEYDGLDFEVGAPGLGGQAFVESTTSDDGFGGVGPLTYDLLNSLAFDEEPGDYVRVHLTMTLATEATLNGVSQGSEYFDLLTAMDGEAIGAGDNENFMVLRNDEVVWEAGVDGDFDPTANISIDARFGDTIGIMGGVAAGIWAGGIRLDHNRAENEMWSGGVSASLKGNMGLSDIPGSKPTKFLAPPDLFAGEPYDFDPIDLTDKIDELGIDDPLWFAAPNRAPDLVELITGYLVEIHGAVATGVALPEIGDGFFDVYVFDHDAGQWDLYEEDWPSRAPLILPEATEMVKILGYEEVLDFESPFFMMSPVGLTFDESSYPSVTITPVRVPEPSAIVLLGAGGAAILAFRRRRAY